MIQRIEKQAPDEMNPTFSLDPKRIQKHRKRVSLATSTATKAPSTTTTTSTERVTLIRAQSSPSGGAAAASVSAIHSSRSSNEEQRQHDSWMIQQQQQQQHQQQNRPPSIKRSARSKSSASITQRLRASMEHLVPSQEFEAIQDLQYHLIHQFTNNHHHRHYSTSTSTTSSQRQSLPWIQIVHLDSPHKSHSSIAFMTAAAAATTALSPRVGIRDGHIHELHLAHLQLTELPLSMRHLTRLQTLDISHNQLLSLPQLIFESMPYLKLINLSGNPLFQLLQQQQDDDSNHNLPNPTTTTTHPHHHRRSKSMIHNNNNDDDTASTATATTATTTTTSTTIGTTATMPMTTTRPLPIPLTLLTRRRCTMRVDTMPSTNLLQDRLSVRIRFHAPTREIHVSQRNGCNFIIQSDANDDEDHNGSCLFY